MEEFGREGLADEVADFARHIAPHGALNSLSQVLLRITAPGIPDTYQGTELWSFTLVDPDNRAPVDYQERRRLLDELGSLLENPEPGGIRTLLDSWQDGRIKLLFTALALRCRLSRSDIFDHGACAALQAGGSRSGNVVAYARALDGDACITVVPRWTTQLAPLGSMPTAESWSDTVIRLPADLSGRWRNILTGEDVEAQDELGLQRLFAAVPFALLARS
jgi:(1->4)-alpha-D-glucan 1-alpha-D-glucosylmutase